MVFTVQQCEMCATFFAICIIYNQCKQYVFATYVTDNTSVNALQCVQHGMGVAHTHTHS